MPVLANEKHERFCQELFTRMRTGGKLSVARSEAYVAAGFAAEQKFLADNARKLANQKPVKARMAELYDYATKLAGIDASWALLRLKESADAIVGFNLDDYLGPPDSEGNRYYDLGKVPRDKLGLLTELTVESETILGDAEKGEEDRRTHKIKLKGPSKFPETVAVLALMARIGGWEAPRKIAPTDPTGTKGARLTLEGLVTASFAPPKEPGGAAEPSDAGR